MPAKQKTGRFQQELINLAFAPLCIRADSVLSAAVKNFHTPCASGCLMVQFWIKTPITSNQDRNGFPLTFKRGSVTTKIILGKVVQSPSETTYESHQRLHCYTFIHTLLQACCPSRLWEEKGKNQNRKS